jgi:ribonuclease BN (tRNA processing enzyme)
MRFRVLGCAGSIAGNRHTTSFLVDDDIVIDAGTGLGTLPLEALSRIDHVFLSHSHMDHVALLPMLVDSTLTLRRNPIVVHGIERTLKVLSAHVFNWKVSPDFREIRVEGHAAARFSEIEPMTPVDIGGRGLTAIPVVHSVPTVAYRVQGGAGSLVVATDMTVSDAFWPAVNAIPDLRYLLIETAFQDARLDLCRASGHLCPSLLRTELRRLERPAEIFIVHMKPSAAAQIRREIAALDLGREVRFLADGDVLEL